MQPELNFTHAPPRKDRTDSLLNNNTKFIFDGSPENCSLKTSAYLQNDISFLERCPVSNNICLTKMTESPIGEPSLKQTAFHTSMKNGQIKETPKCFENLKLDYSNSFFSPKDHSLYKDSHLEYASTLQKRNSLSPQDMSSESSSEEHELSIKVQSNDFNQNMTADKKVQKGLYILDPNQFPHDFFDDFYEVQHNYQSFVRLEEFYKNWPSIIRKHIYTDEEGGSYIFEIHPNGHLLTYKSRISLMIRYISNCASKRSINFSCALLNTKDEVIVKWEMDDYLVTSNDFIVGYVSVVSFGDLFKEETWLWIPDYLKFDINLRVKVDSLF